ncbi:MAG: DUF3343 domain-containing protein [Bacillota bacterium]
MTFHSTHAALEFEKIAKEEVDVKSIPVPRQISSSCGIAARFEEEKSDQVQDICQQNGIDFDGIYRIYQDKSKEPTKLS